MRVCLSCECPWCHERFVQEIEVAVLGQTSPMGRRFAEAFVTPPQTVTHRCAEVTVVPS
jgi:hypothetical protein